MRRKLIYILLLSMLLMAGGTGWYEYYRLCVPGEITIRSGRKELFDLRIPARLYEPRSKEWCSLKEPFILSADTNGSYTMQAKLFGFMPLKTIQVEAVTENYAIPCGCPVGIYMKTDGVMVIDTVDLIDSSGKEVSPAKNILRQGDYIVAVNYFPIHEKEELVQAIDTNGGMPLILTVRRNGEVIDVTFTPAEVMDGIYKAGIWVRDDMQGIGTLTYIADDSFGALGHGVNDVDTGLLVEAAEGELHRATVLGIDKGSSGSPGSVMGSVDYSENGKIGVIERNTECGILGTIDSEERIMDQIGGAAIPIGYKQDVHIGKASIWSDVSGQLREYTVEITELHMSGAQSTKGIELVVTDPELIGLTGGIIQGMSGSPIIQDGRLIGAVTHVFVKEPTRGYGIFLEEMM